MIFCPKESHKLWDSLAIDGNSFKSFKKGVYLPARSTKWLERSDDYLTHLFLNEIQF